MMEGSTGQESWGVGAGAPVSVVTFSSFHVKLPVISYRGYIFLKIQKNLCTGLGREVGCVCVSCWIFRLWYLVPNLR